jgi:hypothetical protein
MYEWPGVQVTQQISPVIQNSLDDVQESVAGGLARSLHNLYASMCISSILAHLKALSIFRLHRDAR